MNLSVAIQAGGESRRMGQDKALVPFLGEPLVQRVCRRLEVLGAERFLTGDPAVLAHLGHPCFPDLVPGRGALGGLFTALSHAEGLFVAVVACDMPFASPELLRLAVDRIGDGDVCIFRNGEGLEPLHALYRRATCLPAIRRALEQDRWRVDSWFPEVRVRILEASDHAALDQEGLAFLNVNTPEDLARAEDLARRLDSRP